MRVFMLLSLLILHTGVWATPPIVIKDPWVREAPPTAMVSAAYMLIENTTDADIDLLSGKSNDFAIIEIHDTVIEDDVAKMVAQDKLTIPAQQTVTLAPGGLHVMLIQRQTELKAGDKVDLTLYFSGELTETLLIPVKKAED